MNEMKSTSVNKIRQYYLDNLSAILIIYMIFVVHLTYFCKISGAFFDIFNNLFFFFMSWFFFKSGMFFKEKPAKTVLISTARRLLVPYIIFNIFGIVVLALEKYQAGTFLSINAFAKEVVVTIFINEALYPNLALWFLFSLFIVRNLFNLLNIIKLRPYTILAISLIFLFTIYYLCYYRWANYENIPFTFAEVHLSKNFLLLWGNIFCGMTFYSLGYILKYFQFKKELLYICIPLFIVHIFFPANLDFRVIASDNLLLSLLYALSFIILFDFIFKKYADYRVPALTYIGQNTMTYYVVHYVFMSALFNLILKDTITDKITLYITTSIITIIFLYIADRIFNISWLKWIVGK